ncbi:MAG: hypothetical protein BZY81_00265 [SAR202 cluster bacterium Io17-Chloro-G4]|nr:MAG: hypothetical protein BZY81_00265 [SAR202 cluster bacterium Io17-Chloro-G4]
MASEQIDLAELNIVDVHVHVGPEFGSRDHDALSLAKELALVNMKAVMKNHFISTTGLASLARNITGLSNVFGSVVLNHGVGGVNVQAVRAALSGNKDEVKNAHEEVRGKEPTVVWMPTFHSKLHLETFGHDYLPEWVGGDTRFTSTQEEVSPCEVVDGAGNVLEEVQQVLRWIASNDLVLATSHLSKDEITAVVRAAVAHGVQRIIITHPFFKVTDMTVQEQQILVDMHRQLTGGGQEHQLYLEYTYTGKTIDGIGFELYAEAINKIGPEHVILSSDAGQTRWPRDMRGQPVPGGVPALSVSECWKVFIQEMLQVGISQAEIVQMASANPSRLLGIG